MLQVSQLDTLEEVESVSISRRNQWISAESDTSGKARVLRFVNRSNRLETSSHLKVAAI